MPVTATWSGDTLLVFDIEQAKVSSYVDATVAAEDVSISPDFITPVVASGEIGFVAVTAERGVILRQPLQAAHNADSTWLAVSRFRPMSGVTDTLIFEPVRMITLTGALELHPTWRSTFHDRIRGERLDGCQRSRRHLPDSHS
ncbi:MAG: hypothetical protein ACREKN_03495 [Longimicrobiaceae bacterium]